MGDQVTGGSAVRKRGLEVLERELGLVGMFRFMWLMGFGEGDYTTERHKWVDALTMDEAVAEVRERYELPGSGPREATEVGHEPKADVATDTAMLTGEEIRRKGLDALERELGAINTLRFLGLMGSDEGDRVAQCRSWLEAGRSLDDIIAELTRRRLARGAA